MARPKIIDRPRWSRRNNCIAKLHDLHLTLFSEVQVVLL